MFVEKLETDQIIKIVDEIVPKTCKKIEINLVVDENPSIELDITDSIFGNYQMYLFDTYLFSRLLLNDIQRENQKLIKLMYEFFGEAYKVFYLKQLDEIFK